MTKYIVTAGCSIYSTVYPIIANSLTDAEEWAYLTAIEEFESYEGLHGLMSFQEFCEDAGYHDLESEAAWEEFYGYREDELVYHVTLFDETNEFHLEVLKEEGGWIEI